MSNFESDAQRRPQSTDEVLTQTNQIFFASWSDTAFLLHRFPHHCHHSFAEIVELLEALKPVEDDE